MQEHKLRIFIGLTLFAKILISLFLFNINNAVSAILIIYSLTLIINLLSLIKIKINIKYDIAIAIIVDLLSGFFIYYNLFAISDSWIILPIIISSIYLLWNNSFLKSKLIDILIYVYAASHIAVDLILKVKVININILLQYLLAVLMFISIKICTTQRNKHDV